MTEGGEQEDAGGDGKDTEREKDVTIQTTGKVEACVPTGFTVLGGFENKPVQKVL